MAFKDIILPPCMSLDLTRTITRRSAKVTALSGDIYTSEKWAFDRRSFRAGYAPRTLQDLEEITNFWRVVRCVHTFRVKDPFDYKSSSVDDPTSNADQTIGVGDGAETIFQLVKRYSFGAEIYDHPIYAPVSGTVTIAFDGVNQASGWSVSTSTGEVTFTVAPANAVVITAGYEYDIKCQFEDEEIETEILTPSIGQVVRFNLIENPR